MSVVVAPTPLPLAGRLPTLGLEPTLDRTPTGPGRATRGLHPQCPGQLLTESVEGDTTVAHLRPLVVSGHRDHRPEAIDDPLTLEL